MLITLVSTSARVAPGLLTAAAWDLLRVAAVWTASPEHPQLAALRDAGIEVSVLSAPTAPTAPVAPVGAGAPVGAAAPGGLSAIARLLAAAGSATQVAWLLDPVTPTGADSELLAAAELPTAGLTSGAGVDIQRLTATRELPGSALLDAVMVMDRLRSPGGCPWDAGQTHTSLAPYLLEEAYEAYQAIEDGDLTELREELGDVLMQVLFHARVAAEAGPAGWDVDDVATGLVEKLIRRHPHVFGDVAVSGADDVATNWDAIKATEKNRKSVTEGVPLSAPALFLTAKLLRRAGKLGLPLESALPAGAGVPDLPGLAALVAELAHAAGTAGTGADSGTASGVAPGADPSAGGGPADELIGDLLFAAVALAGARGVDPETALRGRARLFRDRLARAELAAHDRGAEPGGLAAEDWKALWESAEAGGPATG